MNIHTVILAAGEGSRMLSNKAKSLQPVGGQSMLKRIYTNVADITHSTSFVVGFGKEAVLDEIKQFDGKYSHANKSKLLELPMLLNQHFQQYLMNLLLLCFMEMCL